MKRTILITFLIGNSFLFGQNEQDSYIDSKTNSIFLEGGGNAVYFSFNIEKKIKLSQTDFIATRLGIAPNLGFVLPVSLSYIYTEEKHSLEIGVGALIWKEKYFYFHEDLPPPFYRIMYRHVSDGGFMYGIGLTPFKYWIGSEHGKYSFIPWLGLDIGCSF